MEDRARRPLVILGATGTLGRAFARACDVRGIPYHLMGRCDVNLEDARSVDGALERHRPWAVVNAAGYVRVDEAERDAEACVRINAVAAAVLAAACSRHDVRLVCFSSDLVFDGSHGPLQRPYVETDPVSPLSVYGHSKAEMEARVLDVLPGTLVVRTAALFGPWDTGNFVTRVISALRGNERVVAATDAVVSPTYVVDLVNATLDLLIDREAGIWHLSNVGAVCWADLAHRVAELTGLPSTLIDGVPTLTLRYAARRPRYAALASERGAVMPHLDNALQRYMRDTQLESTHRVRVPRAALAARRRRRKAA
jgi:dTDP-4-dehydrorhamnose reductase